MDHMLPHGHACAIVHVVVNNIVCVNILAMEAL